MKKKNGGFVPIAIAIGLAIFSAGVMLITNKHSTLVAQMDPATNMKYFGATAPVGPGVVSAVANNPLETGAVGLFGGATAVGVNSLAGKKKGGSAPAIKITNNGNGNTTVIGQGNTGSTDNGNHGGGQ